MFLNYTKYDNLYALFSYFRVNPFNYSIITSKRLISFLSLLIFLQLLHYLQCRKGSQFCPAYSLIDISYFQIIYFIPSHRYCPSCASHILLFSFDCSTRRLYGQSRSFYLSQLLQPLRKNEPSSSLKFLCRFAIAISLIFLQDRVVILNSFKKSKALSISSIKRLLDWGRQESTSDSRSTANMMLHYNI